MTTKDIINQMEKEFNRRVWTNKMDLYPSVRTLLESFGEEVCPEWIDNPYGEVTNYSVGRRDERKAIRLKVKEIISSIGK